MYSVNITGVFKIILSDEGFLKLRRLGPTQGPLSLSISSSPSIISTEEQNNNELNNSGEINL
jgi:hypothetical protein